MAPRLLCEQNLDADFSAGSLDPHTRVKNVSEVERNSTLREPASEPSEVCDMLRKHQEQLQIRLNLFFVHEEKLAQQMLEMTIQGTSTRPSEQEHSKLPVSHIQHEQKHCSRAVRYNSRQSDGRSCSPEGESDTAVSCQTPLEKKFFSSEFLESTWTPKLPSIVNPDGKGRSSMEVNIDMRDQGLEQPETIGESHLREKAVQLVRNPWFDAFFFGVVIVNVLVVGVEVHLEATRVDESTMRKLYVVQRSCSLLFMIELFVRICADRCEFFCARQSWMWNWFDAILVLFSVLELGLEISRALTQLDIDAAKSLSIARILRILRITRIARSIRFVRALRILLVSIISSLKTVGFALLLVMMVIYVYAIILTQAAAAHLSEFPNEPGVAEHWGDLIKSMLTLFYCISSGLDWSYALNPLLSIRGIYGLAFLTYVIVMFFAVLNAVTGAFCSGALESQTQDRDRQLHDLIEGKKEELRNLATLIEHIFLSIDSDRSGDIDMDEFIANVQNESIQELLSTLDLRPGDAWAFFRLLDKDESGNIDMDKFISACLQLRGPARSIDLAKIMHDQNVMRKQNTLFMEFVVDHLGKVRADIAQQALPSIGADVALPFNTNFRSSPSGSCIQEVVTSRPS